MRDNKENVKDKLNRDMTILRGIKMNIEHKGISQDLKNIKMAITEPNNPIRNSIETPNNLQETNSRLSPKKQTRRKIVEEECSTRMFQFRDIKSKWEYLEKRK